jgi:hypothetical protein
VIDDRRPEPRPIDLAPVAPRLVLVDPSRRNHVEAALWLAVVLVGLLGLLWFGEAVIVFWDGVK